MLLYIYVIVNIVNNGIYHMYPIGGVTVSAETSSSVRKKIYFNAPPDGKHISTWHEDDETGRQKWILEFVQNDLNGNGIYHIKVSGGTENNLEYLSVNDTCCREKLDIKLVNASSLTYFEEFVFEQRKNWFHIYPRGNVTDIDTGEILSISDKYLGVEEIQDTAFITLSADYEDGMQRWVIELIDTVNTTITSTSSDYFVSPIRLNWYGADQYCNDHCNSELASIHTGFDNLYIIDIIDNAPNISSLKNDGTWFGLNQIDFEGNDGYTGIWNYTDETPFDFGNFYRHYPWEHFQPDGKDHGQWCARFWADADNLWDDEFCDPDLSQQLVCNECQWNVLTKYVLLEDTYDSQPDAQLACENIYGTDLASIHSDADQKEAALLCELSNTSSGCWIGLYNADNTARYYTFYWNDETIFDYGSSFDQDPWKKGNPNNLSFSGMCVQMVCLAISLI